MIEFELQGHEYRAEKLDAFSQLDVSCYLAPIIPTLIPVFVQLAAKGKKNPLSGDLKGLATVLQPFADGLAKMPVDHRHFVLATCLGVVRRKVKDNWAAVWSTQGGSMFEDMDLGVMLPLIVRVVQDSLGPFIAGLLTAQTSESSPTA